MNCLFSRVLKQILVNQSVLLDQLNNASTLSISMIRVATVDLIEEIDEEQEIQQLISEQKREELEENENV